MTLAGQTDEAVREDPALGHRPRVGGDRVVSGRPSHGPAGTPRRDPRAASSPTRMRVLELGVMPNSAAIRTMMSTCLFATAT